MSAFRAPRFSIVLPTHHRADVLPFAIRSALWQTLDEFELLVVGDGCSDGTADVVAAFREPRIRWFDLPKAPGIGYANRNVALREARGRYIAYLAHDDLWFPDHLERLGVLLDRPGVEFAYSRGLAVGLDGRITPFWYNLEVPGHRKGLWRGESAITMCTVVHSRECLARHGFWDESMLRGADIAMWHRILSGGDFRNLAFLPEPTALHFVANWRNTGGHRARARLSGFLVNGFLDRTLAEALRLPVRPDQTQQEIAWTRLADDPLERVREIRQAVVQVHDAVLWKARTTPELFGLRSGLVFGAALERLWRGLMWIASKQQRDLLRHLRRKTQPFESGRR